MYIAKLSIVKRQFFFLMAAGSTAATIALLQPLAPSFAAIADSCSVASYGSSCVNVKHEGLKVESVQAIRLKGDAENICNYTATLTVTIPGVPYPSTYKPRNPLTGQCSVGKAWISFPSYKSKTVPAGTTYCTRWYENDIQQGKSTCVTIK